MKHEQTHTGSTNRQQNRYRGDNRKSLHRIITGISGLSSLVVCNMFAPGIEPGAFVKRMFFMNNMPPLYVTNRSYTITNDV